MAKLTELKNIGSEMERKLHSVEIYTADDLQNIGCKETFFRLKTKYPNVCLVHLYVIYGALHNIDYNSLPKAVKSDLKTFCDGLK